MSVWRLILCEIAYRKLNFGLGVLSVLLAAGCLVAELTLLRGHDLRTEALLAERETQTQEQMQTLEDDYRKITKNLGFNLLILPKEQNLGDLYAADFAARDMPEEYAHRLAHAQPRLVTINHLLPSLQAKVKWPEQGDRTIILMGVRGEVLIQNSKQKPIQDTVRPGKMVIGHELHKSLKLGIGDKVRLLGREFTIAKLQPERGNKDDITVWINLAEAQELLKKPGRINAMLALECNCETTDRLSDVRGEIGAILPDTQVIEFATQALARAEARNRAAKEAVAAVERVRRQRAELRGQREALAAILVPVVLLAAIAWVGLLAFGNVRARRTEIGILRALGLRSGQVAALFLGKAVLLGLAGALLGCITGTLLGALGWESGTARNILAGFDPLLFLAVVAAAPLLAAVAAWLPALLAVRQDPALILREE
jgi:putative ABC transport system permease protein